MVGNRRHLAVFFLLLLVLTGALGLGAAENVHYHVHAYSLPITPGSPYEGKCPVCGGNEATIADVIGQPTCTEGVTVYVYCNTIVGSVGEGYIPALGHDLSTKTTKKATCTEAGTKVSTCSRCSYSKSETIPALGHDFAVTQEIAPTCTAGGTRFLSCTRCGVSYTEALSPWGHSYHTDVLKEATCLEDGENRYTCSRCGNTYTETVEALGHDYVKETEKEATCTEEGLETETCSRCGDRIETELEALGHDVEYEETEPTCTEDGKKEGTCKRCGELVTEKIPALGHDMGASKVTKEPTCTEKGQRESECKRCGYMLQLEIAALGHDYPDEWTVEKAPTFFAEGLESRTCRRCGERVTRTIPKKDLTPVIIGTVGTLTLGGLVYYLLRKIRVRKKIADKASRELFKPAMGTRSLLVVSEDEELVKFLKGKKYLQVSTCAEEELKDSIAENGPDLVLLAPCGESLLPELPALKEAAEEEKEETGENAEASAEEKPAEKPEETAEKPEAEEEEEKELRFGLLLEKETAEKNAELLKRYKEDGLITGALETGAGHNVILTKLILPVMKPDVRSDESLSNIGAVADLLGIPGISAVLDAYVAGRDVKSVLESEEELGFSDAATIIADIAGVLGMDTVAGVAGLVGDVESIQAALDKEAGAYEHSEGVDAAKDVVDVVGDIIK